MQASKITSSTSFLTAAVLLVLSLLCTARTSSAYSVPTSFSFQGYLVDQQFGDPVTTSTSAPLPMKFTLIINGTNVWAAAYTGVNVTGGSFTVNLGANDPGAQGIDPNTQQPLNSPGVLPITPQLLTAVTDKTPVVVQVQVGNGQGDYDTLTPSVPVNSALFALKAETINGFYAHQLAKQDNSGNILDSDGSPVISSGGAWVGTQPINEGPQGPEGAQGPAGPQGETGTQGQGFNFTGAWDSDTSYNPYDVVTFDGSVWVVGPDGEPDGENPEADSDDWSLFAAGFSYLGTWGQNVYYFNDVVLYNGSLYIANGTIDDTEGGLPPNQDSSWSLYLQGFNFTGPYDSDATYYTGDVVYYEGSSYVDFGGQTTSDDGTPDQNSNFTEIAEKGATGQQGQPGPQGPAGPPTPSGARWVPLGMTAKDLTAIGGEKLTTVGTAAGSSQPDAYYIRWTSAAGNKKTAGVTGPFTQTKCQYHSVLNALIRTGSTIQDQRIWVALSTADLSQTDGIGSLTTKYIGLRYSTSAEDSDWQIAAGDGTSGSVTDSGVTVAPNTTYHVRLDWTVDGQLTVTINGVVVGTQYTNVVIGDPANAGIECVTTSLGSKAVTTLVSHLSLVYDGNDF